MNAWTPHAHGLLGAVVVVVATLFQGVGVEAPRAAALRRRAAEAPLVVARQALAGAERAVGASHHVESYLVAAQRISLSVYDLCVSRFCELACCKTLALTARLLRTLLRAWNGLQDGL